MRREFRLNLKFAISTSLRLRVNIPVTRHSSYPDGIQQPQVGDLGDLAERGVDLLCALVFQPSGEMF